MKKIFTSFICLSIIIYLFCGCSDTVSDNYTEEEIINKAIDYLGEFVPLEQYDIEYRTETLENDQYRYVALINQKENNTLNQKPTHLSLTLALEDSIELTLHKTTTSDLINCGFKKGDQKEAYAAEYVNLGYAADVYLLYNNKYLHVGEDRRDQTSTSGIITYVLLPVDVAAVDFNYLGVKSNSSIEEVISCLGYSVWSTNIIFTPDDRKCMISLGYIDTIDDYLLVSFFNFNYDYKKNSAFLNDAYLTS